MKKIIILVLALCLVLCACNKTPGTNPGTDPQTQTQNGDDNSGNPVTLPAAELNSLQTVGSYGEVYKALSAYAEKAYSTTTTNGAWLAGDDMAVAEEAEVEMEAPASEATFSADGAKAAGAEEGIGNGDFSETNVQTEGVDEADIVKTDGRYIYHLNDNQLIIYEAADGEANIVSETEIFDYDHDFSDYYEYFSDMYLAGDSLVLIGQYEEYSSDHDYKTEAVAQIYNISDREAPVKGDMIGQTGYINTTRLVGNMLYIISNEYVYDYDESEPTTYIPCVYRNGEEELVAIDDICLPIEVESTSWLTVSAYDVTTGERISTKTMLGSANTVYMSQNNIYVAEVTWQNDDDNTYTEDQYKVTEHKSYSTINIHKFAYDAGQIEYVNSGAVNGTLMDQFSLDEYNGNLRVVTTSNYSFYKDYHDEKHDFHHYEYGDNSMTNGLYILDESMSIIGSVDKLAEDERVYSCRFLGDVGYFVTFRQTDPLFAVDVSDPSNPKVLSELKITGFSEYLHGWKDGKLLGIGMDADDEGRTQTMKLSMFDVSDPANVTEEDKLVIPYYYSEALYNHHAVFVDVERGLIGFSAEGDGSSDYVVYSYGDDGFTEHAKLEDSYFNWNMRGVRIGNWLYIVDSESINVIEL